MQSPRESLLCQYRYDPLDRLIANALSNKPEHQRFYCQSRLTTEIQGAMRFFILQHDGRLLAQQQDDANTRDTTLLASDQQRSILQALKASHPLQPIAYSPYGHRSVLSGLLSLLGFNGERPESATGHYLLGNGYRAFNPVLMRFNSPDSLSPFDEGGLNGYAYCSGDPINRTDHSGRIATKVIAGMFSHWRKRALPNQASATHSTSSPLRIPRPSLNAGGVAPPQTTNAQHSRRSIPAQPATLPAYSPWDPLGSIVSISTSGIPESLVPPGYFKFQPPVSFNKFPAIRPVNEQSLPVYRLPEPYDATAHETLNTYLRTTDEINARYDEMRQVIAQRRQIRSGLPSVPPPYQTVE